MVLDIGSDLFPLLIPVVAMTIPVVAIVGGVIVGVVKSVGRQRMLELAQRERIAAIERGVDLSKLPPLDLRAHEAAGWLDFQERPSSPIRRAQGLIIGGIVTLFSGFAIAVFLLMVDPEHDKPVWAVGLIPMFVGVALLLSAWIVWPRGANGNGGTKGL